MAKLAKVDQLYARVTSKEVLAPAIAVAVVCIVALIVLGGSNDKIRNTIIKSGLLTAFVIGLLRLALGLAGWPLWLLTGGAFVLSGGYNASAQTLGLPQIPGMPGYRTKNAALEEQAQALCQNYGGFSHWVAPASNCKASAECADHSHYAHIGCD